LVGSKSQVRIGIYLETIIIRTVVIPRVNDSAERDGVLGSAPIRSLPTKIH